MLPPVDLKALLLIAILNPAVIAVALWMGSRADEWQKVPIAAFAAALAGAALVYIATWLGLATLPSVGRAAAGVFIAQCIFGLVWASAGYWYGWRRP